MILFLLMLIPAVVAGVMFWFFKTTITWKEWLLHLVINALLIGGIYAITIWQGMSDTEHLNGRIVDKRHGKESCCHCHQVCSTCTDANGHSYSCNCHEVCSHSRDYWWAVDISTGHTSKDGCNGSSSTPKWWKHAYINEPASVENSYQNYLLADPESLFQPGPAEKYIDRVPDSIPQIQSRYKVKKVIRDGVVVPSFWETKLREINSDLGAKKQIDFLVYFTKVKDPAYADAVAKKWLYGPKNSVILVLGVPDQQTVAWARVVTISRVEVMKVELRDYFLDKDIYDPVHLDFIREQIQQNFKRTPMAQFEYLANAAAPSGWGLFFLIFFDLLISIGLGILMHKKDVFGDEGWRRNQWPFRGGRYR